MNFLRIAEGLDVAPLLERLRAAPELWTWDTARSQYPGSAHTQAQQIILRWAMDQTVEAAFREIEAIDYPAATFLQPQVSDLYLDLLGAVGECGDLGRAMITRLPPGAEITPHIDEGLYADHYDRFHVCLQADEGSQFICGREQVVMRAGEAWWFNHKREHRIVNSGGVDRLHLIVDVVAPTYRARRGMCYQAERFSDLWEEFKPLFHAHWREIARYEDIALDPDREAYLALEASGGLRTYTARRSGQLVGYAVFFVRPHLHYRGCLQAFQDLLYLHPDHRRGMAGVTLIRVAETRLRAEGVQVVYHHAKRKNQVGRLLMRLGYELVDEIYAKRLDEEERK